MKRTNELVWQFSRFELSVPVKALVPCSNPTHLIGERSDGTLCVLVESDACVDWQEKVDFSHISDEDLRDELQELSGHRGLHGSLRFSSFPVRSNNERYLLAIAALNIRESAGKAGKNPASASAADLVNYAKIGS